MNDDEQSLEQRRQAQAAQLAREAARREREERLGGKLKLPAVRDDPAEVARIEARKAEQLAELKRAKQEFDQTKKSGLRKAALHTVTKDESAPGVPLPALKLVAPNKKGEMMPGTSAKRICPACGWEYGLGKRHQTGCRFPLLSYSKQQRWLATGVEPGTPASQPSPEPVVSTASEPAAIAPEQSPAPPPPRPSPTAELVADVDADAEVAALRAIWKAVACLDLNATRRVFAWAQARKGFTPSDIPS